MLALDHRRTKPFGITEAIYVLLRRLSLEFLIRVCLASNAIYNERDSKVNEDECLAQSRLNHDR